MKDKIKIKLIHLKIKWINLKRIVLGKMLDESAWHAGFMIGWHEGLNHQHLFPEMQKKQWNNGEKPSLNDLLGFDK